jgi:hypothetical protein
MDIPEPQNEKETGIGQRCSSVRGWLFRGADILTSVLFTSYPENALTCQMKGLSPAKPQHSGGILPEQTSVSDVATNRRQ